MGYGLSVNAWTTESLSNLIALRIRITAICLSRTNLLIVEGETAKNLPNSVAVSSLGSLPTSEKLGDRDAILPRGHE